MQVAFDDLGRLGAVQVADQHVTIDLECEQYVVTGVVAGLVDRLEE